MVILIRESRPLISVIIPAYNVEKYIQRCIESIRKQTYSNLQIVIVDDGSTDQTGKIADSLSMKDSRIQVLHKQNQGVSAARNSGLEVARGGYIGFVDGDDYIEPVMYEKLIVLAEKYDAKIAHCGYQMVFPNRIDLYYGTGQLKVQDSVTGVRDLLEGTLVEPGLCNKLYASSILKEIRLDNEIKINEDLLLNYMAFCKSEKSVFLDEPYYHYIIRKNSATTSEWNKNKLKDPLIVLETMDALEEREEIKNIIRNRYIHQLMRVVILMPKNNRNELKSYKREARGKLRTVLSENKNNSFISRRNMLLGRLAVLWPWGTWLLHQIYSSVRGTKNKYKV